MNNIDAAMPFRVANYPESRYAWTYDPAWRSAAEAAPRGVADDIVRVGLKQRATRMYATAVRRRVIELQVQQHEPERNT
jgi:hypothetical protein